MAKHTKRPTDEEIAASLGMHIDGFRAMNAENIAHVTRIESIPVGPKGRIPTKPKRK